MHIQAAVMTSLCKKSLAFCLINKSAKAIFSKSTRNLIEYKIHLTWAAELSLTQCESQFKRKILHQMGGNHACVLLKHTSLSHSGSANFNKDSAKLFHLTFTIAFLQTALSDQ